MAVGTFLAVAIVLLSETSSVLGGAGTIWGYQDGVPPANWPLLYRTCNGLEQSPIDIQINRVRVNPQLGLFDFTDLNMINNLRLTMENNGHTVEVAVNDQTLFVTGGGLPGPYIVKQWHYHWGSQDSRGSEHDINGRFFPMEMHVVLYSAMFDRFEVAKNMTGGLAVLSFLFDVGEENPAFDEVINHMNQVRHKDDHVDIAAFALTSLFPRNSDVFYRYYGGLTTPPCYESVIWTVFKNHIRISERQINQFRMLSDRHIDRFVPLSDNFRPTQPLNNRIVYTNDISGLSYSRTRWPTGKSGIIRRPIVNGLPESVFLPGRHSAVKSLGAVAAYPKSIIPSGRVRLINRGNNIKTYLKKTVPYGKKNLVYLKSPRRVYGKTYSKRISKRIPKKVSVGY